jgi:predicted AlkP superfamily phosphohydrolase/phosphomutase
MKNSLRLALIVLALLTAVGLTVWLTGYREVPDEPGRACLARRIDGVVPLTSGTTIWLLPLFEEIVTYDLGLQQLRRELPLECADGRVTLELLVELELEPATAVLLVEALGADYDDALVELAVETLAPATAELTRAEIYGPRRRELVKRLSDSLSAATDGLEPTVALPTLLEAEPPLEPPAERRVIVLGIDALDDKLLADFTAAGWLPNFSRLLAGGYSAVLDSEAPYYSPVIWSTIGTGLSAAEHGVTDFTLPDGAGDRRPVTANDRRAPTYWEIAAEAGLPPLTVSWFASWPAGEIPVGVTLSSYAWEPRYTRVYEPTDDFTALPRRTWPEGLMDEINAAVVAEPYVGRDDFPDAERLATVERQGGSPLVHYLRRDILSANALLHLMDTRDWRAASVYLEGADVACHLTWPAHALWWERRSGEPALIPPRSQEYLNDAAANDWGTLVRDFYRWNDAVVGVFLDRLEPGDILLVLSDHGFAAVHPPEPTPVGGGAVEVMSYWHDATGMLLLYGDGVRRGEAGPRADVYDICPTVLALLGLPPAAEMPGEVLTRALEPSLVADLEAGPLAATIDSYGRFGEAGQRPELSQALAEIDLERLRALGYLQ